MEETIPRSASESQQPKLTSDFLDEDVDVETAVIVNQLTKDNDLQKCKDDQMQFFVGSVPHEDENHVAAEVAEVPVESEAAALDIPQITSAYLSEHVDSVIEPFTDREISVDASELFFPALSASSRSKNDIEIAQRAHRVGDKSTDGHFSPRKPFISERNRAQFVDRTSTDNSYLWISEASDELVGIFDVIKKDKIVKTQCDREIRTTELTLNVNDIGEEVSTVNRILVIHIDRVEFLAHPSFTEEHLLARELHSLYEKFETRKCVNIIKNIEMRLEMVRMHLNSLPLPNKQSFVESSGAYVNYRKCSDILRNLRARLHHERKVDRDLKRAMLAAWAELKAEREKSTPKTSLQLVLLSHSVSEEADIREFNRKFNLEYIEVLQEAVIEYELKRRQRNALLADGDKDLRRPSRRKIREELLKTFNESMRPPGEDVLDFSLRNSASEHDKADQFKYTLRVMLDGKDLNTIGPLRMSDIGNIDLNTRFSVKFVSSSPQFVEIEVYLPTSSLHPLNIQYSSPRCFSS